MNHLDEMELRSTIERRDDVIRNLENDLRKAERENRELREKLAEAVEVMRQIECMAEADPDFYRGFVDAKGEWTILAKQMLTVLVRNKNVRRECNATTAAESGR